MALREELRGARGEVEEAEWAARKAVIEAQRRDAAAQREAARQVRLRDEARRQQARRNAELVVEARVAARLEAHSVAQAAAQREQDTKDALRQGVREELQHLLGRHVRSNNLLRLLMAINIKVPLQPARRGPRGSTVVAPPAASPDALRRGLKQAKVTYHPDKMRGGDLRSVVFAEEISKILNAWDTSSIG